MHPLLYEINTRCWLNELSRQNGRRIDLASVPDAHFVQWRKLAFTHIWLMGVWCIGPKSRAHSLAQPELQNLSRSCIDWTDSTFAGSAYAVEAYEVSPVIGGSRALGLFRRKLQNYGLKLILDFVPNHVGLDHQWLVDKPHLFIHSSGPMPHALPMNTSSGKFWFAHGRDPYFPPWADTVQLDYRRPDTRQTMVHTLLKIADLCDGVRCDMAMLVLNEIFAKTWSGAPGYPGPPSTDEFWSEAIEPIRAAHPHFLFLAEAYWGLEPRLLELGFDYAYDKSLRDLLIARDPAQVQRHLLDAPPGFVQASAHFLENHDEPRIAGLLSNAEHQAAALLILGIPGMRFLHQGQLAGFRCHTPVHFCELVPEEPNPQIAEFYERILTALPRTSVARGYGEILRPRQAWDGNPTCSNFVITLWQTDSAAFDLVVVNLANHHSQCRVSLSSAKPKGKTWQMRDLLGTEVYRRDGDDLDRHDLFLDLPAHGAQLFEFVALP